MSSDFLNADITQSFFMYGYDAGVLGGVQETEPFHRAMGVSNLLQNRLHKFSDIQL